MRSCRMTAVGTNLPIRNVRFHGESWRLSGRATEIAQSDVHDPTETWAAQDFRSAKALFVPSLKRDIVPSIACTRPPAGGSHGNPHPTARIHIHTGRRSSCVAARGARAASRADAAHRRAHEPRCETIRKRRPASRRSCRGCENWAGPTAAMCDRLPLGRGRCRPHSQACGRIGRARAGRHPGHRQLRPWPALLQATRTVPIVFVASPIRSAPALSIAWRGRAATPPVSLFRIRHGGEMAGAAQRDRAARDASGGPS